MNRATYQAVYAFICTFIHEHDYSPSIREIAQGCYMSHANVHRYLDMLERDELIVREPGKARSIRLPHHDDRA